MTRLYGGYRWLERVQLDSLWQTWRAVRERDGRRVLIKVLRDQDGLPDRSSLLAKEWEVLSLVSHGWIVQAVDLEPWSSGDALVLDDFGGRPVRDAFAACFVDRKPLGLDVFLRLALAIVGGLEQVHRVGWVHAAICPDTVWSDDDASNVRIAGFTAARRLGASAPTPEVGAMQRPYVAPELSGLTGGKVDQRADLYAAGALFYELLVGRPPFATGDLLSDVHGQLARRPTAPASLVDRIPNQLSDIVLKLLNKDPSDRYQSAAGLMADLQIIQHALDSGQRISMFPLGRRDAAAAWPARFRTVGRDAEAERLIASLDRVANGTSEVLLLVGAAGVGKTRLGNDLLRVAADRGGLVASAKFEEMSSIRPLSGVTRIFRALIRSTLASHETSMVARRQRLLASLSGSADVLVHLVPSAAALLGPRPAPTALPPAETVHRSHFALRRFVRAYLLEPDRPCVLFFDDLHWADPASVEALGQIVTECSSGGAAGGRGVSGFGADGHRIAGCLAKQVVLGPLRSRRARASGRGRLRGSGRAGRARGIRGPLTTRTSSSSTDRWQPAFCDGVHPRAAGGRRVSFRPRDSPLDLGPGGHSKAGSVGRCGGAPGIETRLHGWRDAPDRSDSRGARQ